LFALLTFIGCLVFCFRDGRYFCFLYEGWPLMMAPAIVAAGTLPYSLVARYLSLFLAGAELNAVTVGDAAR